ncbi:lysosome-associated membrane glycoprotein 5 [Amblyomma americanum]
MKKRCCDVGLRGAIAAAFVGVILCACFAEAIDYEETVVWQPDPQHKYVALREVKPRVQSRANEPKGMELGETTDDNATEAASASVKAPPSDSQKVEPPANAPPAAGAAAGNGVQAPAPGAPAVPPRAPIPEFSFGVWNATDGTVCILAKFQVFFTITYASRGGLQTVTLKMPESAKAKGICATEDQEPVLELTWPVFRFILMFSRVPPVNDKGRGSWKVSGMEIQFNTNSPFFPGATNAGKRTARSSDNMTLFETPMGESYFCPTPKLVTLTDSRGGRKVAVQFKDLRIQAYDFQGTYGPAHRCSQVRMAGVQDPFPQDETVPIAVGSTLAVAAVAVVVGYALYRSVFVRRVDYNTMN